MTALPEVLAKLEHPALARYWRAASYIRKWYGLPDSDDPYPMCLSMQHGYRIPAPTLDHNLATLMDDMALAIEQLSRQLREHGPALLRDAGDGDSARLDWLESGGRVSHDKVLGMFVAAHGGGTPYWNATYRGAIDDAISGYKDTAMHAPGGATL